MKNYDIGLALAMLLRNRCENVVTGIFGDTWKVVGMPLRGILSNVEQMYKREGEVGYSTNGYKVIEYLRNKNIQMDKVMMFTDCQMWNSYGSGQTIQSEWEKYKEIAAQVRKSVDSPPGMLTEDHHHTVHEERQVCYSSHLRPKSLHL